MAKNQIQIANADKIAARLIARFAPGCDRIQVAGSIRRQKNVVGDIEIVAIPTYQSVGLFADQQISQLQPILIDMITLGHLATIKNGPKYKSYTLSSVRPTIQLDLFLANEDNWGLILALRTGPAGLSKRMVTSTSCGGLLLENYRIHGGFVWRHVITPQRVSVTNVVDGCDSMIELDGEAYVKVPVRHEAEFFDLLSIDWMVPEYRH